MVTVNITGHPANLDWVLKCLKEDELQRNRPRFMLNVVIIVINFYGLFFFF